MSRFSLNFAVLSLTCLLGNIAISSTWEPMFQLLDNAACERALGAGVDCGAICKNETADNHEEACHAVADGANRVGNLALVTNGGNFLTIALLGEVSDAFGRKAALVVAILGAGGTAACLAFYTAMPNALFLGLSGIGSLGGGQFALYAALYAALADMTTKMSLTERTKYFAFMTVLVYAGLCVGPVGIGAVITAGVLTVEHSFWVAIAISGAMIVVVLLLVVETRVPAERTAFSWMRSNPLGGVAVLSRHRVTVAICGEQLFVILGTVGVMALVPVLMVDANYSALETALWQTCLFAALAIGNILVVPGQTKAWGTASTIRASTLVLTVFMSLFAIPLNVEAVSKVWVLYLLCIPVVVAAGWDAPAASLAVTIVGQANYGLATAGLNSIKCLMQGLTAKVATALYAAGQANGVPWLPFAVCAGFNFCAVVCSLFISDHAAQPPEKSVKRASSRGGAINSDLEREPLLRASNA